MKKTLRLFGTLVLAVLFAVSLPACGDDDDEPDNPTTNDPALVGSWTCTQQDLEGGIEVDESITFTFKADGTYVISISVSAPSVGFSQTEWESGRWTTNSAHNEVTMTVTDSSSPSDIGDTYTETYAVDGDVLIFDGDIFLTRD